MKIEQLKRLRSVSQGYIDAVEAGERAALRDFRQGHAEVHMQAHLNAITAAYSAPAMLPVEKEPDTSFWGTLFF